MNTRDKSANTPPVDSWANGKQKKNEICLQVMAIRKL